MMLRANYTEEEWKTFQRLRYSYPDERVMRRFELLWLHACGKFAPEIAHLVRQTPPTVRGVMNLYKKGGIPLVTAMDSYHPASDPAQHRNSIISEFQSRPPRKRQPVSNN
ncbi:MAG: hypothetical protein LBQ54_13380, partial [Planctomycetaceae bacterium]|nr:hypothetical protein [Planctomycetaceae bacterium]